jgi:FtsP/CotA-like multicopper oxidase with cupredoxin domain
MSRAGPGRGGRIGFTHRLIELTMPIDLDRRRFMVSSFAVTALGGLGLAPVGGAQAAASQVVVVERRNLDIRGKAASVFGIRQPNGSTGLTLDPGERFQVKLVNKSGDETVIHWHGQTPPNAQDGVTETGSTLIAAGDTQSYDFAPRPGTHWMHSHHGLQEQLLMAAPLVVRSAEDLKLDAQEVTVLLHDFTFRNPAEVLAHVTGGRGMQHGGMMMQGGMMMPHQMVAGGHAGKTMSGTTMDLNDFDFDAYLANDRTLDDPLVVRVERNGRVRLRLINGATSTAFWIELGAVAGTVLAVDGNLVQPVTGNRFPIAQGQRLDLLIPLPVGGGVIPVLAQREGDRTRTGIILATPEAQVMRVADRARAAAGPIDLSIERRLVAATPLAAGRPSVSHRIALTGSMMPYAWSIDGHGWEDRKRLHITQGQRVVLEMVNRSPMAHPMHLHGHHFQVVGINGKALQGAMRDTVLVPIDSAVTIAFDADNPGNWLLHCHNLLHMATGMMTEVAYGPS